MKQLGRLDRYLRQLFRIAHVNNIPSDWASPDQRCRAAIKAMGQYGRVIHLTRKTRLRTLPHATINEGET